MAKILLPQAFDIKNISYETVVSLKSGGKTIPIRYNGTPLILQTPEMTALFGSSSYSMDKDKPIDKKSVELSFKGAETKKSLQKFMDNLAAMDEKIKKDYFDKSQEWARKSYKSMDVLDDLYTPLIRYAKDKETGEISTKYSPTFRINLPFDQKDNKLKCDIYNVGKELLQIADIERGSQVTAIIQCTGIWLAAGKFGCSWKVMQLRLVPPQAISGFAFKDVEDDDEVNDDLESEDDVASVVNSEKAVVQEEEKNVASSSESEDEEEVKKKVVKRITRKKDVVE